MKKTCALFVAGSLLAIIGYFFLIRHYIPEIPIFASAGVAVLGGVSFVALFGAISTMAQTISDKLVLSRAERGQAYRDGKRAAAIGTIDASGLSTVVAPFSGRECLAYEYEVYELITTRGGSSGSTTTKKLHCSGFGMAPSHVRTMQGDIRVLGFPLIDQFPADFTESEDQRERAHAFFAVTQFQNIKKNIGSVFSEFDDLFLDADGAVRKDLGDPVALDERHRLTEIIIPRGTQLCAFGVYSGPHNALIAKTAALPIRFIPGNARQCEERLRKTSFAQIAFALFFFCVINGIIGFLHYSFEKSRYSIPQSQQAAAILQTAESGDYKKLDLMFKNGINPDAVDAQSRTLLQTTPNDQIARFLLQHGANPNVKDPATMETPLFDAARSGNVQRMDMLIKGGADINAISRIPWRHTPIDEAIRNGQSDAIELLLKSGAKDPRITATNGHPLVAAGEEFLLCRQYLQAIQNVDKTALKSMTTERYEYFFDDVDFAVWKSAYPLSIESFSGYGNESAATISMRGRNVKGRDTEWVYQLEKQPDGWKIHQTWPLTGEGTETVWR